MTSHPVSFPRLRPLTLAMLLALAAGAPGAALAQAVSQTYDLPAAPLATTLNRISRDAGLALTVDSALVGNRQAAPVRGQLSPEQALHAALAGSGLQLLKTDAGTYTLRKLPPAPAGEATLAPMTVTAGAERSGPSEGNGSYTTRSTATATRLPLSLRETPQSVSIVTRQRIEDENLTSIENVLDRTAGISVQNMGTRRFQIFSRGYAIDNYQIDGILTSFDVGTQNMPVAQSDLILYDRLEILRGASGLLTGAGDPSGTINLIRKKPTREFQGYASVGVGSWERYRSELDVAGPINQAGSLRGRFVGALEKGGTHIDYYKIDKSVVYGVLEADLGEKTTLTAGLDYQKSDPRGAAGEGLPLFHSDGSRTRFSPSKNAAARWSRDQIEAYTSFVNLEHALADDWLLKFSANHLDGKRDFSGANASWGYPDRNTGDGVMLYGGVGSARQQQSGFDMRLQGRFAAWGRQHDLVLGYNWSDYKNFHEPLNETSGLEGRTVNIYTWNNNTARPVSAGDKLFDYDDWQRQYGSYGALRLKAREDLALIVGARVSTYQSRSSLIFADPAMAAFSSVTRMRKTGVVTPYAGVVYDLDDSHSIYASYTSIFKPQSARDRNGKVLDPRTGDNYEIGLKSEFFGGRLNTAVALYEIRQDNLAEADPGYTVPGTIPAEAAYRSVKGAKTRGIDLELGGELQPGWQASLNYNLSTTEDAAGQRIGTTFPRQMAKLWTTYRLPGAWQKLTVGGGANWQSRIYYSTTDDWLLPGIKLSAEQKAYAVVNLMARYEISKQLSATLNVNNLFDKEYLQGLDSRFNTAVYAPTRNAMLAVRYNF